MGKKKRNGTASRQAPRSRTNRHIGLQGYCDKYLRRRRQPATSKKATTKTTTVPLDASAPLPPSSSTSSLPLDRPSLSQSANHRSPGCSTPPLVCRIAPTDRPLTNPLHSTPLFPRNPRLTRAHKWLEPKLTTSPLPLRQQLNR